MSWDVVAYVLLERIDDSPWRGKCNVFWIELDAAT